jgi:hypothetical protein
MAAPAPSPVPAIPAKAVPVTTTTGADEVVRLHVLAVDDSNVDRAVIATILRSSKYRGNRRRTSGVKWGGRVGWGCYIQILGC